VTATAAETTQITGAAEAVVHWPPASERPHDRSSERSHRALNIAVIGGLLATQTAWTALLGYVAYVLIL
jgi:hypothetical protein